MMVDCIDTTCILDSRMVNYDWGVIPPHHRVDG